MLTAYLGKQPNVYTPECSYLRKGNKKGIGITFLIGLG